MSRIYMIYPKDENFERVPLEANKIYLENSKIKDFSALSDFPNLEQLKIQTGFFDLTILKKIPKLNDLIICNTDVENIHVLRELNLRKLDLYKTNITDFSFLRELKDLRVLRLVSCEIKDLCFIRDLNKLEDLDISKTKVKDLSIIRELNIVKLCIDFTEIEDLSPLRETKLQSLSFARTKIKDITPLNFIKTLTDITCDGDVDLKTLKNKAMRVWSCSF